MATFLPMVKLLDSTDAEEVKMWADKLRLILLEMRELLQDLQTIINNLPPPTPQVPGEAFWTGGAFFPGEISVGQTVPRLLIPENADGFVLTHLKASFQGGTPTGDTEIEFSLITGGVPTLLGTLVLESTDTPDLVYSVALVTPGQALTANDLIKWDCVTAGAHEEVTAWVSGRQAT